MSWADKVVGRSCTKGSTDNMLVDGRAIRMRVTDLGGTDFVKRNKGKGLSHHGYRKIALGKGQRDKDT
jgi:hypothetical protein